MSDAANSDAPENVLRRITTSNGTHARAPLPVHRAFRKSLAKIADDQFEIELDIRGVEDKKISQQQAIDIDIEKPIFFSVSGPKGGPGLAVISMVTAVSLVELQTVGSVSPTPNTDRPRTQVMAMLAHGFIQSILTDLGGQMASVTGEEWIVSQTLGSPIFDMHRLPLEIPDIRYRMLRGNISFGKDGPVSDIALILPAIPTTSGSVELGSQTVKATNAWKNRLNKVVHESRVTVQGILLRDLMSVDDVRNLAVGGILPLPDGAEANIHVEGLDGVSFGVGKIGMMGLSKAIRLHHVGETSVRTNKGVDEPAAAPIEVDNPQSMAPENNETNTVADLASVIPDGEIGSELGSLDLGDLPELDIAN